MSEANWVFIFYGELDELKRDIEAYEQPEGVTITIRESNGNVSVDGHDTALGGRNDMPYPNQIAFLDYITETDGYKAERYQFSLPFVIGVTPHWTILDYLKEKYKS